jgi:hypothetical protein
MGNMFWFQQIKRKTTLSLFVRLAATTVSLINLVFTFGYLIYTPTAYSKDEIFKIIDPF